MFPVRSKFTPETGIQKENASLTGPPIPPKKGGPEDLLLPDTGDLSSRWRPWPGKQPGHMSSVDTSVC